MSRDDSAQRPLAGSPFGLRIGLLACVAMLVGYFLPWVSLSPELSGRIGVSAAEVRAEAADAKKRGGEDAERGGIAERLAEGVRLAGSEWKTAVGLLEEDRDLTERQRRTLGLMSLGLDLLPFVAVAMAVLLLLMSIRPRTAMKAGGGPLALVFGAARIRSLRVVLLVLAMLLGLVTALTGALLWLATRAAPPEAGLGKGVLLLSAGGVLALVGVFLGYGRGRLRALLAAILLLVALLGYGYWRLHSGQA